MNIQNIKNKWLKMGKKENNEIVPEAKDETMTTEEQVKKASAEVEKNSENADVIDLRIIFQLIFKKKWWYVGILPIVAVLSAIVIMDEPRYYNTSTTMAPEIENPVNSAGGLSSIASSFGFDLSNINSQDAISPTLYPDLMADNGFVTELFNIHIKTADGRIDTTYYAYLKQYQEQSWLSEQKMNLILKISEMMPKNNAFQGNGGKETFDPYYLSKKDDEIVEKIRQDINIDVDKKTGVISIGVTSQDPLVCKILADSVRSRLQAFIIKYRTSKSQRDVEYYQKLTDDAKKTYETTRRKYAKMADENFDVVLETEKSKLEDLENTMQLQYNTYTGMSNQLEAARAKLRMNTPVFTVVKGAAVPIKPEGPKRMIFIATMLMLAFFTMTLWFSKDELLGKKKTSK